MCYDFSGKTAVVTGASRGIGRGIALELAQCGADVVGVYVSSEDAARKTEADVKEKGVEALFLKCDVASESEVDTLKNKTLEKFGKADFIVNNAGIHQHLKSWVLSLEDWNRVIQTNLTSAFLVTKAFTPMMKERRFGKVVHISSCAAFSGTDHEVHYAASKSGMLAMTKSHALELATYGINVNAIAPGYIATDMVVFEGPHDKDEVLKTIPKNRIGEPADIAKGVSYLCSDGADYMTGQILHINGGLIMY